MNDKLCNFITLYRSPNQSQDDSESFIDNFELNLDSAMVNNPFLSFLVILMRKRVSGTITT